MIAPPDGESLRAFYTSTFAPLRLRGKSLSTKNQYLIQLRHFARFLGHEPGWSDLDDEVVGAFLASIVERGNSPATANKARNHLLSLWRFGARKGRVAHYPDVAMVAEPRRIPKAWMPDELEKLFAATERLTGYIAGIPRSRWWYAAFTLCWWTGERIGAILQIRWSDYDSRTGWLTITAETRKRKTADMSFELPPEARTVLESIRRPKRDLILPWPGHPKYLWERLGKILVMAGLPNDRKSKFHRIRKSTASYFEAAGGNATELLGHSQRSVTRAYLDPRIVKADQPATRLFRPHTPKPSGDRQMRLFE